METLENRCLLSGQPIPFALFHGEFSAPGEVATVRVQFHEQDYDTKQPQLTLGFLLLPATGSPVDPGRITILSNTGVARQIKFHDDAPDSQNSFALARATAGSFTVRVQAEGQTVGAWSLQVYLVGDVDGSFQVNQADVGRVVAARGRSHGDADWDGNLDVNSDGRIDRRDVKRTKENGGASVALRSLSLTAGLAGTSDPDGNHVVLENDVRIVGQTTPIASVRLDLDADGTFEAETLADVDGRYQFLATLPAGFHEVAVEATDPFGQTRTASCPVRVGDVVANWNATFLNVIRDWTTLSQVPYSNRIVPLQPPRAARDLAILHVAIFDAINSIEGEYEPYFVQNAVAPVGAEPVAAVAGAAHRVLTRLYPKYQDRYDAGLTESLALVPDGQAESESVSFGQSIADQILAWRATDGSTQVVPYVVSPAPGIWQPTHPDFLPALLPQWPGVTPFALPDVSMIRAPAPPSLDSAAYATALNEVKELGRYGSTARTAEKTEIALFWADGGGTFTPAGHWNQIAQDVVATRGAPLLDNARSFALLNVAMADAGIASWDTKYFYDFWRPIDAIRKADLDGNAATEADPNWIPLLKTPPFPSYTSGHSTFSSAAATVLTALFGDDTAFSSQSDGHLGFTEKPLKKTVTRSFTSFHEAAKEASLSRLYGGIHFSFDSTEGIAAGNAIGNYVMEHLLSDK